MRLVQAKLSFVLLVSLLLLCSTSKAAESVRISVHDKGGGPLANVLVILRSLEGRGEVVRVLTNDEGRIPDRLLDPGIYRVIATCPYGICKTNVREFLVRKGEPLQVDIAVAFQPTKDNVTHLNAPEILVSVIHADGKPAVSVEVLIRDETADQERWYRTNEKGELAAERFLGPLTFVVVSSDRLTSREFSSDVVRQLDDDGKPLVVQLP
jgi:hypothetical protein